MKKRSRKLISILLTLALLATLLVPMATPAAAGATYTMSNVVNIPPTAKGSTAANGNYASIGSLTVNVESGSVTSAAYGRYVYIELPTDFIFTADNIGTALAANSTTDIAATYVSFPAVPADYAFSSDDIELFSENGGNRLKIGIKSAGTINYALPGTIIISGLKLFVPSGAADGPVTAKAVAPSSSVFTNATFDIAKVGASTVKVFVNTVGTVGPDGDFVDLYVQEGSTFASAVSNESLKLTLPSGYKWDTTGATEQAYWGVSGGTIVGNVISLTNENRTLVFDNDPRIMNASYFKLRIKIDPDETTAKTGNIEVTVGGASTYTPSSLVVGTFGDYGANLSAASAPDIYAGKLAQKVGNIVIDETLKGSLINNRTVTLTLPSGAKWSKLPSLDTAASITGGATVTFAGSATDARALKITLGNLTTGTSEKAKLVFKDAEVITAADFNGELKATASGSLGFTNELTIAKVKPAVSATVADTKELKIGVGGQAISDLTIEEAAKELMAYSGDAMTMNVGSNGLVQDGGNVTSATLTITAPTGVTFEAMPTVTVEGDVKVDASSTSASLTANKSVVTIPIQSTSTKPSKVIVKNIKLNVDRTVVEGDVKLAIGGSAIIDDTRTDVPASRLFEPARVAAEVVVGKVVTPAPVDTKSTASFVIGKTTYTVAGVEKTMDVAPYVKNGRTYLPVRYVASALGVLDSNILWDEATQKVTLLKGDKVVQMTIGSTAMIVNGVTITMDSAPEITSGRTMLPFRFIAQAMGSSVAWDEATQTVTLN